MKKMIGLFLSVLMTSSFFALPAFAKDGKVSSILYVCGMTFKASGKSASIILGFTYLKGEGELSCYDILTGVTQKIPISVKLRGPAVGLSYQSVEVSAKIAGVGISRGPESLLGRYLAVRESAALGIGVGVTKSLRVAKDAVVVNLSVQGVKGIGAQIDILSVDVQARDEDREETQMVTQIAEPVETTMDANPSYATNDNTSYNTRVVSTEVVQVRENQPIQIIDDQGRVIKVITLKLGRSNN